MPDTPHKTIAKNTIVLYLRMLVTMVISLFTSRVVLQTLGVDDYGLYQAVGGIVGIMGFINGALSTGTSRFITYSLGKNDKHESQLVFSTALTIHIVLAIIIVVLAETVGLWFLYNKLVVPPERMSAAVYCFHLSVLASVLSITQVPYNALIIGHEHMKVYAYAGVIEAILKLAIVYVLYISPVDKLKAYSTLFFLLSAGFVLFYRGYCIKQFNAHYHVTCDKKYLKEIGAFSGWSMIACGVIALNSQGVLILFNMFFSPAIVAARAISIQVNTAVLQFMNNFRTAVNPQIIKRWAAGEYEESKRLVIDSTKFSYYLVLVFAVPIIFTTDQLLHLWLGVVPDYTVRFVQLILVQSLLSVWDVSLYQALFAGGRIRENALTSPAISLVCFVCSYVWLKLGGSPLSVSYMAIVGAFLRGAVQKPIMLVKIVHFKWHDFMQLYPACIGVTLLSMPIPMLFYLFIYKGAMSIGLFFAMAGVSVFSVAGAVWLIGLTPEMKRQLVRAVKEKLRLQSESRSC